MSAFDEIAAWLRATIEGDKAAAERASSGPWSVDNETYAEAIRSADGTDVIAGGRWGDEASVFETTEDAVHIARHDSRDAIARCDAELKLVDLYREPFENGNLDEEGLRVHASGYRYRDGYKSEWKPLG